MKHLISLLVGPGGTSMLHGTVQWPAMLGAHISDLLHPRNVELLGWSTARLALPRSSEALGPAGLCSTSLCWLTQNLHPTHRRDSFSSMAQPSRSHAPMAALIPAFTLASAAIGDSLIKHSAPALAWMLSWPILLAHGWSRSQRQMLSTSTPPCATAAVRMFRQCWQGLGHPSEDTSFKSLAEFLCHIFRLSSGSFGLQSLRPGKSVHGEATVHHPLLPPPRSSAVLLSLCCSCRTKLVGWFGLQLCTSSKPPSDAY